LTMAVKILVIISLLANYPLQMWPVFEMAENKLFHHATFALELKRTILRSLIVLASTGVAIGIPKFSLFLSLVGSISW